MKNKRIILITMVCIFTLALVSSPVVAYMIKRAGTTTNTFVPAAVECQLNEKFTNNEKTSITVTNKGNIDAYIRVRLVTYYEDENGILPTTASVSFDLGDNWIKDTANNTYYYKEVVEPNAETGNLLKTNEVISLEDGQVVVVLAEAIQAKPTAAVADTWKVTINADGEITAVA